MPTLFEITGELQAFNDLLDERGGDLTDPDALAAFETWLADLAGQEAMKLDSYVSLIKQLDMEGKAMLAEAKMFQEKADSRQKRIAFLKERLRLHMERTGQASVRTAKGYTVFVCGNGGKPPLAIDCAYSPDDVSEGYTKREFNREAIRAALEAGATLSFARLDQPGTHLRIK